MHGTSERLATDPRAQFMANVEVGVQALDLLGQALWPMGDTPPTQIETPEGKSDEPPESFFDA